ncbi:MAG: Gfo/Idh/MocA family oxidoreductase [Theionarchaea archaeon]|nr:Gfo/Idh/MocA family oxidoreductase [Theionarchaea archaeon]
MRAAVIGVGGIGRTHVQNLSGLGEADLVAIADLDREKAKKIQEDFGVPSVYNDYEEMMDRESPDGVFICTPPSVHLDPIKAAAERGIAVFVEKPLDCDIETAKESVKVCKSAGIVNQMGYHWRFNEGRVEARRTLLEKGGTLGMFEGKWWGGIYNVPWWIRRKQSGGQITEQTTHIFDQSRWLMGDVDSVQGLLATRINTDIEGYDIEDVSAVLLKFKSGSIGVVTSTNAAIGFEVGIKVIAENVKYSDFSDRVVLAWKGHEMEFRGKRSAYEAEEAAFISAVESGDRTQVDLEEGLRSLELSLGAIESSRVGERINLPL